MMNIHRLPYGMYEQNTYLAHLEGREDCIVIDPGARTETILKALSKHGLKPCAILITHGHYDHLINAAALRAETGAPIYIHELDAPMLKRVGPLKLPKAFEDAFTPAEPDHLLADALSLCGMDIEVLHTPGHSRGSVCFYLPEHKQIFTGDTLFVDGMGRTDFPGGSVKAMQDSLRRLFTLPDDVRIHPGHGGGDVIARVSENFS